MITSLNEAVLLSLSTTSHVTQASLKLKVDGEVWHAYEASITHRDILFYCDKGIATYLVDTYGGRNVAELFDWEKD